MTAPARAAAPQPAPATPTSPQGLSLIDKVIDETLRTKESRARIETYLPRGIDFEAVMSDVYLATRKNPDLMKCDRASLVDAVVEVQQRGLRVGSTCHLVPKGGKVCAWNDIRGDVEMIVRSGACRHISAHVVYEHEPFTYAETATGPELRHEIITDAEQRGPMKGAYARFWLGGNRYMVKYMPLADIEVVRAGSLQWNKNKVAKCPAWYALKTVIRQGAKYLPKNKNLLPVYVAFDRDAAVDSATELPGEFVRDAEGDTIDTGTGEIVASSGPDPVPATSDGTPENPPAHGSLEWAQNLPLPLSRSEFYNRPLGTLPLEFLQLLPEWCEQKMNAAHAEKREVSPAVADLYTATQILLEAQATSAAAASAVTSIDDEDVPGVQPAAGEPTLAIEEPPPASPPGSNQYRVPQGGTIQDALPWDPRRMG